MRAIVKEDVRENEPFFYERMLGHYEHITEAGIWWDGSSIAAYHDFAEEIGQSWVVRVDGKCAYKDGHSLIMARVLSIEDLGFRRIRVHCVSTRRF